MSVCQVRTAPKQLLFDAELLDWSRDSPEPKQVAAVKSRLSMNVPPARAPQAAHAAAAAAHESYLRRHPSTLACTALIELPE